MYSLYHSHDCGVVFLDHGVVHLAQSERVERELLHFGSVDTALYLCYLDLCHLFCLFAVEHFLYRYSAVLGNLCRAAELVESCDCSFHEVVGV